MTWLLLLECLTCYRLLDVGFVTTYTKSESCAGSPTNCAAKAVTATRCWESQGKCEAAAVTGCAPCTVRSPISFGPDARGVERIVPCSFSCDCSQVESGMQRQGSCERGKEEM